MTTRASLRDRLPTLEQRGVVTIGRPGHGERDVEPDAAAPHLSLGAGHPGGRALVDADPVHQGAAAGALAELEHDDLRGCLVGMQRVVDCPIRGSPDDRDPDARARRRQT